MKLKKILMKLKTEKNKGREKLVYEANEYTYSFKNFQTIKTFGRDIYEGNITLEKANKYQSDLLVEIMNFREKTKPQSPEKKNKKKKLFLRTCVTFLWVEKKLLMLLKAKYF